ncbi:MAG: hypothetical protein QOI83_2450 [Streptomycetaceae bacterium]|nr:hypothetical protein [Streptomycetaceae bacterium]
MARIPTPRMVVGPDVHTFDAISWAAYRSHIPPMRAPESASDGSGTPIYDALCSEYRRLFRTLPGDRSGEEALQFNDFSGAPYRPGRHRGHLPALPAGNGHDNRMHG